jgi:phage/plasmid-like protein (TIGR03299 family)
MPAEVESMMYAGEVPWHGLGTYVGDNPVLAEEAIQAASLDWEVVKAPGFAAVTVGEEEFEAAADDWYFTVRTSDKKVLGAVKGKYRVLQNRAAFEFMDTLAGDHGFMQYHTAGSLKDGRVVWMLAEVLNYMIEPVPGDVTKPYVLLVNGHDGNTPLKALFTTVRVVCQNTLNLALSQSGARDGVTIRHTGKMSEKLKEAKKVFGYAQAEVEAYQEVAQRLARKRASDKMLEGMLDELFPLIEGKSNTKRKNKRETIQELYETGPGADLPGVRGTAWGALQAVTNYTTHHRATRGADDELEKRENRLMSTWFGSSNRLNRKALNYLMVAE